MQPSVSDCLAAIDHHTRGLAAAAEGNLEKRIEHCPDWSMADLVWHLIGVHNFWNRVATDLPLEQPAEIPDSERPADDELIQTMIAGMEAMADTLGTADQTAACWTWGQEEDVWFITRHQVQEAAVHHWDAANAAGHTEAWRMDARMAADAVEEFLTHSVANPRWPMVEAPRIDGTSSLGDWTVTDGETRGTVAASRIQDGQALDPSDLLLWLFKRIPDPGFEELTAEDQARLDRFRALTFTD